MSAGAGEQNHSRLSGFLDLLDFLSQAPGQSRRERVAAIGAIQGEPVDGTIRLGNQLGHGSLWGTGMLVPSATRRANSEYYYTKKLEFTPRLPQPVISLGFPA